MKHSNFYKDKKVYITGGAGFIGSHLLDELISRGAQVTIGDNLSTGSLDNVLRVWGENHISYKKSSKGYKAKNGHAFEFLDFQDFAATQSSLKNHEIIFHLAANIGGRGYIDTHPADCCEAYAVNQNVIKSAHLVGADRILFASSACVYPEKLQSEYSSTYLLKEEDAFKENWGNADKEYGWAKLMGEQTLKAYQQQYGLKGSITRYVTAYGPWENDTHAIIALIRRAVEKHKKYVVWGTGKQDRDFTYVDDIVSGTLAVCEHITDAQAINLGTASRYTISEVIEHVFEILSWRPHVIHYDTTKPEGVKTRALDNTLAKELTGWVPKFDLRRGLVQTIDWFIKHTPESVETIT